MVEVGSSSDRATQIYLWTGLTFDAIWPDVEQILLRDKARWEGYYTLESLKRLPAVSDVQVFTFHDAGGCVGVLYTQFEEWPVKVICRFLLAAAVPGKGIRIVRDHLEFIELWAKRRGASQIEVIGREGWIKVMPPEYTFRAVHLAKDLDDIKEH